MAVLARPERGRPCSEVSIRYVTDQFLLLSFDAYPRSFCELDLIPEYPCCTISVVGICICLHRKHQCLTHCPRSNLISGQTNRPYTPPNWFLELRRSKTPAGLRATWQKLTLRRHPPRYESKATSSTRKAKLSRVSSLLPKPCRRHS